MDGIAIGSVASFLMIQWMPSCVEGLYWYNGAINYGLFYTIMLLLVCTVIGFHMVSGKGNGRRILFCYILGFLLEGGNHVTAFMGLLFVFGTVLFELSQEKNIKALTMGMLFVFMAICFLVNVTSPGTAVRQAAFAETKLDVMTTIYRAIRTGMSQIGSWVSLDSIVGVLLVMPVYCRLIKKVYIDTTFRFPNPFLIFVGSVAWICVMYCPPLYAMGFSGSGRLQNVVYYNFVILLFINAFYCLGWVMCRYGIVNADRDFPVSIKWICCAGILLAGLMISKGSASWGYRAFTTVSSGEAYQYSQEAFARNKVLLESEGKDVVVQDYSVKPELIFFTGITDDPNYWTNQHVSGFYRLNSIAIRND